MANLIPNIMGEPVLNRNRNDEARPRNTAPRAARKHAAPRLDLGGNTRKRTRVSKEKRLENLRKKFKSANFQMTKPLDHVLEQLDAYMKRHMVDAEPLYLRQILRTLHGFMPAGDHKRIIRGTLQMFTRWKIEKIWQRVTKLMQILSEDLKIQTFETPKKIPITRIVSPLVALRECTRPTNRQVLEVTNEKILRLKMNNIVMEE